jgi:hypothetical protein
MERERTGLIRLKDKILIEEKNHASEATWNLDCCNLSEALCVLYADSNERRA